MLIGQIAGQGIPRENAQSRPPAQNLTIVVYLHQFVTVAERFVLSALHV